MTNLNNEFIWYELHTTDAKAAEAFYSNVIGWNVKDAEVPDTDYRILSMGQTAIGGLMTLPEEACNKGARPGWLGYVAVEDVDTFVARIKQAGGALHYGPEDIPTVGRFAVVADPQGAVFILFKGASCEQPTTPSPASVGHTGWHELHARDRENAFAFYAELFNWTKAEAVDMGPIGLYQLFATGDAAVGGMVTSPEAASGPFWLFYFNVGSVDAAIDRVKSNGGQIIHGPQQVPKGGWIVHGLDPQGVKFALVGPK